MNHEQLSQTLAIYKRTFTSLGIPARRYQLDVCPGTETETLAHCHAMLEETERFLQADQLDKACRWLGFIQGCLWKTGIFTIDELREHNK